MALFTVDFKQMRKMVQFAKRAPKQFGFASQGYLNTQAFRAKELASIQINKMTNRADKFNRSRIRVQKARGIDINRMAAVTGSIFSPRHTGWIEQETGKQDKRQRTPTDSARIGKWDRKISGKVRMKSAGKMLNPERDGKGPSSAARVVNFIERMRAGEFSNKVFITRKRYRGRLKYLSRGVFQYKRRKIIRMQSFKKPKQPKRFKWMSQTRMALSSKWNAQREWDKQVARQLKFIK